MSLYQVGCLSSTAVACPVASLNQPKIIACVHLNQIMQSLPDWEAGYLSYANYPLLVHA